jgi:hypothetical protein
MFDFVKKIFNDEEKIVGLSGFKGDDSFSLSGKIPVDIAFFSPCTPRIFMTNTKENILLF